MRIAASGFTLIELLVVITIIVVLLALLTPALNKAIYQAELTACGAQLRGIASGANTYAVGNARRYPDRSETGEANGPTAEWLSMPDNVRRPKFDFRPMIEPYIPLKMLIDPFAEPVDLTGEDADVLNISTYSLYFGWKFFTYGRGMNRMGDSYTFDNGTQGPYRFTVIAGDHDASNEGGPYIETSHPDRDGVLAPQVVHETPDRVSGVLLGSPNLLVTVSRWIASSNTRGLADYNYALADGSVERFDDLTYGDPILRRVPYECSAGSPETLATLWRGIPER